MNGKYLLSNGSFTSLAEYKNTAVPTSAMHTFLMYHIRNFKEHHNSISVRYMLNKLTLTHDEKQPSDSNNNVLGILEVWKIQQTP